MRAADRTRPLKASDLKTQLKTKSWTRREALAPQGVHPGPIVAARNDILPSLHLTNLTVDTSDQDGLWETDGTAAGTSELTPIGGANPPGLEPLDITPFGGEVLLAGWDSSEEYGLWVTNGTAAGTYELTGVAGAQRTGGRLREAD
jgi:hypothetical protein